MKTCTHCNRRAPNSTLDCLCGERFPLEFTEMPAVWTEWAMRKVRASAHAQDVAVATREEAAQDAALGLRWTPSGSLAAISLEGATLSPGAAAEMPTRVRFLTERAS